MIPLRKWCVSWLAVFTTGLTLLSPSVRAQNISTAPSDDFIIVLDQSGSMREKTPGDPKQGYQDDPLLADKARGAVDALHDIADEVLKEGDYFALLTFGNASDIVLSQEIGYPHERELVKHKIGAMPFRDKFTDILAGLQHAGTLMTSMNPNRRKILVMITDGKNEPPADSPYASPAAQAQAYAELRDLIAKNKWDIALVGLGAHTNIAEIAQKLNLPEHHAIMVDQSQGRSGITQGLRNIITEVETAQVTLETKTLVFRLQPKLLGGYARGQDALTVTSTYQKDAVEIRFDPQAPVQIAGADAARVAVGPTTLTIPPQQSAALHLDVTLAGARPADGRLKGKMTFQFAADTRNQFFPYEQEFEVLLPSWWEVYGLWVSLAIAALVILLSVIASLIRRAQVPEIRVDVIAGSAPLGAPLTLRKKQSFTIANDDFSTYAIPAKGLTCKTAATVKYLGRRKFDVVGVDAKIVDGGKELDRLTISLEQAFDLKDAAGKMLRGITLTTPGKGGDPFGGSGGKDVF